MQPALFETQSEIPDIEELTYIPHFITANEEMNLVSQINAQPWLHDLKRRVQHYGYKYDYKARGIDPEMYLGPLPYWLENLSQRLHQQSFSPEKPDQVIVNEYQPGQGISAHIDCAPCFGETIASLSLGSGAIMQLSNPVTSEKHDIYLEPCSLIILQGSARFEWQHAIPARKSDKVDGIKISRSRRLSLTFRRVILN